MSINDKIDGKNRVCLNCGTPLTGLFCSTCGQKGDVQLQAIGPLLADTLEKILGIDGRGIRTIKTIVTSPGQLPLDFSAGRRQPYYPPVKIYFATSVAFFSGLQMISGFKINLGLEGLSIETFSQQLFEFSSNFHIGVIDTYLNRINLLNVSDRVGLFQRALLGHAVQVLLILVPIVSLILKAVERSRFFQEHLIFTLTTLNFGFICFLVGVFPWNPSIHNAINNALNLVFSVYVLIAVQRFYEKSWLLSLGITTLFVLGTAALLTVSFAVALGLAILPHIGLSAHQ